MEKKLELKKKTISILSDDHLKVLNGGDAAPVTTSFGQCTGFLCCDPTGGSTITSIVSIVSVIVSAGTV